MKLKMKDGKMVAVEDSFKAPFKKSKDNMTHTHEDGTTHSHKDGDKPHHHHDDGTTHDHEGGDKPHTHDEETPNFEKMTKKALDDWAKENNISVDSKKTKAGMIKEIKGQL